MRGWNMVAGWRRASGLTRERGRGRSTAGAGGWADVSRGSTTTVAEAAVSSVAAGLTSVRHVHVARVRYVGCVDLHDKGTAVAWWVRGGMCVVRSVAARLCRA